MEDTDLSRSPEALAVKAAEREQHRVRVESTSPRERMDGGEALRFHEETERRQDHIAAGRRAGQVGVRAPVDYRSDAVGERRPSDQALGVEELVPRDEGVGGQLVEGAEHLVGVLDEAVPRALHRCGYASQPHSRQRGDGFELQGAYLTAIARCAPPGTKPLPLEVQRCALWLHRELELLTNVRIVLALGGLAFAQMQRVLPERGVQLPRARFRHGVQVSPLGAGPLLIGSYHPSRQNTQTGRLTPAMLEDVLRAARLAAQA